MSKKKINHQPLSPKKYIITKARSLPIYKCLINPDWDAAAMAHVIVCRKHTNGNLTAGLFLVDMLERGLKDSIEIFNKPESEFNEILKGVFEEGKPSMEIEYSLAHNIIYGAIDFAADQGYDGQKKAGIAIYILEEDNEEIEFIDIAFGAERYLSDLYADDEEDEEGELFHEFSEEDWVNYIKTNNIEDFLDNKESVDSLFHFLMQKEHGDLFETPYNFSDIPVTYKPLQDVVKNEKEIQRLQILHSRLLMVEEEEKDALIKDIKSASEKNPDNPIFENYLAQAYQLAGREKDYRKQIETTLKKFPDYFHSRIMYGNILLEEKNLEEFERLFPEPYSPMAAFPNRKYFHFTEVIPFIATILRYFIVKKDLKMAYKFSELIYETLIESDEIDALPSSNVAEIGLNELYELKVEYCIDYIKGLE